MAAPPPPLPLPGGCRPLALPCANYGTLPTNEPLSEPGASHAFRVSAVGTPVNSVHVRARLSLPVQLMKRAVRKPPSRPRRGRAPTSRWTKEEQDHLLKMEQENLPLCEQLAVAGAWHEAAPIDMEASYEGLTGEYFEVQHVS